MAIYGGGWCYDRKGKYSREEIYNELMEEGIFFTDYAMDTSPRVMNLLRKANKGDIIYLKSYHIREQRLYIQAIGKFSKDYSGKDEIGIIGGQKGYIRSVNWIKPLLSTPIRKKIPSGRKYNTTFYEENNDEILSEIMNYLDEK